MALIPDLDTPQYPFNGKINTPISSLNMLCDYRVLTLQLIP